MRVSAPPALSRNDRLRDGALLPLPPIGLGTPAFPGAVGSLGPLFLGPVGGAGVGEFGGPRGIGGLGVLRFASRLAPSFADGVFYYEPTQFGGSAGASDLPIGVSVNPGDNDCHKIISLSLWIDQENSATRGKCDSASVDRGRAMLERLAKWLEKLPPAVCCVGTAKDTLPCKMSLRLKILGKGESRPSNARVVVFYCNSAGLLEAMKEYGPGPFKAAADRAKAKGTNIYSELPQGVTSDTTIVLPSIGQWGASIQPPGLPPDAPLEGPVNMPGANDEVSPHEAFGSALHELIHAMGHDRRARLRGRDGKMHDVNHHNIEGSNDNTTDPPIGPNGVMNTRSGAQSLTLEITPLVACHLAQRLGLCPTPPCCEEENPTYDAPASKPRGGGGGGATGGPSGGFTPGSQGSGGTIPAGGVVLGGVDGDQHGNPPGTTPAPWRLGYVRGGP